jgi:nucleoid-associated protein YgaU
MVDVADAPADYVETINRLQRQIEQLRDALRIAQAAAGLAPSNANQRTPVHTVTAASPVVVASPGTPVTQTAPPATQSAQPAAQRQNNPPSQPAVSQPTRQQPTQTQPPPQPQPPARRHVVKQGDSLYGIARQYYGGSVTNAHIEAIVNANRDQLDSRDTPLRPGMQLKLP